MVTILDIKKAVNNLISSNFKTEILSNKVKDNFKAPAFFTKVESLEYEYETVFRNSEIYKIEIHYFPSNLNDDIELMKIQTKLRSIFDRKLKVKNRYLNITNIKERIHLGTLFFNFNIEFQQYKDYSDSDLIKMENILIERKDI